MIVEWDRVDDKDGGKSVIRIGLTRAELARLTELRTGQAEVWHDEYDETVVVEVIADDEEVKTPDQTPTPAATIESPTQERTE